MICINSDICRSKYVRSSEIWKPCVHATIAKKYRNIVDYYYEKTCPNAIRDKAISDFGFRGMSCLQEATKASAAWLTSFSGTATIPAVPYIERYYHVDNSSDCFATNAISTEHSVMAANFAIDGDEITFVKRLLVEIYPNTSFSMVSDTYDLFNLVDNILPECKDEVLKHDGKLLIRPDSGDIVEIAISTVERLYEIFPGETNKQGYKTLNPHIGCVYGDGVTLNRADKIYSELMKRGFAANCIVFGAGSFSFNAIEEDSSVYPLTRDTFSIAIKATYGIVNGNEIMIFKDPKTDRDTGNGFKKSQRGLCYIKQDAFGDFICIDKLLKDNYVDTVNSHGADEFQLFYKDGVTVKHETIFDIRERVEKGVF